MTNSSASGCSACELLDGVGGERVTPSVEFERRDLYLRHAFGQKGTMARRSAADVTGRVPTFCQGMLAVISSTWSRPSSHSGRHGGDDVADVGRVEGATEDPDPLERRMHGGGF